jgi:hypothetical protein
MDVCLRDTVLQRYSEQMHIALYHCILDMGDIIIEELKLCMRHENWLDAIEDEQDCMFLISALTWVLDSRNPFHAHHHPQGPLSQSPLPRFAVLEPLSPLAPQDAESDDPMDPSQYYHFPWLVHLLDRFGASGGYHTLIQVRSTVRAQHCSTSTGRADDRAEY